MTCCDRQDEPLSYLINVPQQLEALLRHRALKSIVQAVSGGVPTNLPRAGGGPDLRR